MHLRSTPNARDSDHPTERTLLMPPTIILVHGAFAESASWDRVIRELTSAGHVVIAAANPLRGLVSDAAAVSDLVRTIDGPVVLVAHSYGGAVISNVDPDAGDIAGLVYVCGFAPDAGARSNVPIAAAIAATAHLALIAAVPSCVPTRPESRRATTVAPRGRKFNRPSG